ncbi:MAG: MGMT family protein [Bacteroidetes bacterium SB0662_bin_6]|nr:MGMT family protein [Bacteroidetes bacterium SB0668_bin_1]MYE05208.1 MGMT family protein [Bacteroidetes bacterium SB0662_bin_6]
MSVSRENDFFERVWAVVDRIPCGKVTTYGHIAGYLGARSAARTVGWALGAAAGAMLPCHRVVNRFGTLTGKMRFGGPHVMEERLRAEGVTFDEDGCVVLEAHLWDPSEESEYPQS